MTAEQPLFPPPTPLTEYYRLLRLAHGVRDAVDNFDLKDDDNESRIKWRILLDEQHAADMALVNHILAQRDALLRALYEP